jgi:hypothetical protein
VIYRVLADAAMTLHLLFLVYVLLGGFLAWRRPRAFFPHAAVVAYGVAIAAIDFDCPLTPIEQEMRLRAGQAGLEPTGFIDTYIEGVVYPVEYIVPARLLTVLVIVGSWAGALLAARRRERRQTESAATDPTPAR